MMCHQSHSAVGGILQETAGHHIITNLTYFSDGVLPTRLQPLTEK